MLISHVRSLVILGGLFTVAAVSVVKGPTVCLSLMLDHWSFLVVCLL